MTQTAALIANVMRSLRGLSRSYAWLMVLVEVSVEVELSSGKGEANAVGSGQGGDVGSAFSSAKGEVMRVNPGGVVGGVFIDALDVVVGVHDGYGRTREHDKQNTKSKGKTGGSGEVKTRIVEVWKDAVGHRAGEWCLWVQ